MSTGIAIVSDVLFIIRSLMYLLNIQHIWGTQEYEDESSCMVYSGNSHHAKGDKIDAYYYRTYEILNVRIWIRKRLLWAGQGNESRRDHIFVGSWRLSISWIPVEIWEHCREKNGMNKAMVVEHCGLCEKQRISAKNMWSEKTEYCKCSKKHGNKADELNCKYQQRISSDFVSNVIKFRKWSRGSQVSQKMK